MIRTEDSDPSRPRHRHAKAPGRIAASSARSAGSRRASSGTRGVAAPARPRGRAARPSLYVRLIDAIPSGTRLTNRHDRNFRRPGRFSLFGGSPGRSVLVLAAVVVLGAIVAGFYLTRDSSESTDTASATSAPNGIETLPAAEILQRARTAALQAGSARLIAHFTEKSGTVDSDTLVRGTTGTGTVSVDGLAAEVRRIDDVVYLKGNDEFNRRFGGTLGAQLLSGRWLYGPADKSTLAEAAGSLDYQAVVGDALEVNGKLRRENPTTFDNHRVIRLRDDDSYIYIALDGTPYPVAVTKTGASQDGVRFSDWGSEVTVNRPDPNTLLDASQLGAATPSASPKPKPTKS